MLLERYQTVQALVEDIVEETGFTPVVDADYEDEAWWLHDPDSQTPAVRFFVYQDEEGWFAGVEDPYDPQYRWVVDKIERVRPV